MACRLSLLLISSLLAGAACAAELGEPRVGSFIGQPLVADIELTMLEDAATPVQVRLANPNVYRGANISMPPVLSTLNFSVMRRDGRQFLHVTSLRPVEAAHLHLYLELSDGSQRGVRLATLWLSPDPQPAPPPAPVVLPAPVAPAVPVAAPVAAKAAAVNTVAAEPVRVEQTVPAPSRPKPAPVAAPRQAAPAAPPKPPKPAAEPAPLPGPAPASAPAACKPQVQPEQNACVALGARNAMLREQLGQLEDKVKVLQVAMGAAPAAVVPAAKPFKLKKKRPEPPPPAATPWLLVGGGIAGGLALLAGVLVAMRRRKAAKRQAVPRHVEPAVPLGARLKARLGGLGKQPKAPAPAEPAAHESSTQV